MAGGFLPRSFVLYPEFVLLNLASNAYLLVSFFSVAWRKLNYSLQLLLKAYPLQPEERDAGELEVHVNGQLKRYAPLYPHSIIIALSYQLDSTEAPSSGNTSVKSYNVLHL